MVHLQVEQSHLLLHISGNSRDVQLECKHFSTPLILFPCTLLLCRLTAAGNVFPYTTMTLWRVWQTWRYSCCLKQKKGLIFFLFFFLLLSHDKASSGSDYRRNCRCEVLPPWTCREWLFISHDLRWLSSPGLLAARCSKTVKYIVKGGFIGSEYIS